MWKNRAVFAVLCMLLLTSCRQSWTAQQELTDPQTVKDGFCIVGGTSDVDMQVAKEAQSVFDTFRSDFTQKTGQSVPGIDAGTLLAPFKTSACAQSTELVSERDQLKTLDTNADMSLTSKKADLIVASWTYELSLVTARISGATSALTSWQTAKSQPVYNVAQTNALNQCEAFIVQGRWGDALGKCDLSSSLAIPPTLTPTITVTPFPTVVTVTPVPASLTPATAQPTVP